MNVANLSPASLSSRNTALNTLASLANQSARILWAMRFSAKRLIIKSWRPDGMDSLLLRLQTQRWFANLSHFNILFRAKVRWIIFAVVASFYFVSIHSRIWQSVIKLLNQWNDLACAIDCIVHATGFLFSARKKSYNKSFIDQACSVKMAGYWPRSFFACLWTSTSSRSINTQKKNSANIPPSWPHAWSITHMYFIDSWIMLWRC